MKAQELRAVMVRKNYTQAMLAKDLGINQTTLSFKLAGKSQFTLLEIQKISKALGLTVEERDIIFF